MIQQQPIRRYIFRHPGISRVVFVLLWIGVLPLAAQTSEHYPNRNITSRDGLASSTVYSCFKDSRNFMWFATESGVNRYDGTIMETFNLDNGLTDIEVFNMFEDSKGRIWFCTYNGVPCFYSEDKIHNPYNDSLLRDIHLNGFMRRVLEDRDKNIWLLTRTDELICLTPEGNTKHLPVPVQIIDGYIDAFGNMNVLDAVGSLYRVEKGQLVFIHKLNVYIGSGRFIWYRNHALYYTNPEGLLKFDGEKEIFVSRDLRFSSGQVIELNINTEGNIWLGTVNGVYEMDGRSGKELHHLIKNETISSIVQDDEHNYWISTMERGVYFFPSYWESILRFDKSNMLLSDKVKCITPFNNSVLIGFGDGTIQLLDSVGQRVQLDVEKKGDRNRIKDLVLRHDTLYLISDQTFAIACWQKKKWTVIHSMGMSCKDIAFTTDGSVLVSTSSGVMLITYDKEKHTYTHSTLVKMFQVLPVCAGRGPLAWFAMNEHLYELNYLVGTYTEVQLPIHSRITDLVLASNGSLGITTAGEGVFVLREGKVQAHISGRNGLSSSICRHIFTGEKNDFWITTYKGLDHLQPVSDTSYNIRNYGPEIGIPDNGLECFFWVSAKQILVGSDQGMLAISLNKIPLRANEPLLYLTSVEGAGHSLRATGPVRLPYLQSNLSVSFRGVAYSEKNHLVYAYRLLCSDKPADTLWRETDNHVISFFSLDAGNYMLEVKCRNNNSNWSKIQVLPIWVEEPFWKNIYFLLVLVVFAVVAVWWVLRRRLKRARRIQERLERRVSERTSELSQAYNKQEAIHKEKDDFIHMVAHDLRNPLTSILFSVEMIGEDIKKDNTSDTKEYLEIIRIGAERMKMLISNLLDMSLLERGKMKINIETVYPEQICKLVLSDYVARAAVKQMHIVYRNEIPAQDVQSDKSALTQILDNLISNAVKYNTPGKNIYFTVVKEEGNVVIRIQDEGPGLSEEDQQKLYTKFGRLQARPTGGEDSTGIGLYIVKKLADMLQAGLSFESKPGEGTTFILKLPTP